MLRTARCRSSIVVMYPIALNRLVTTSKRSACRNVRMSPGKMSKPGPRDRRLLDHPGAGLDPFGPLVPLGEPREMRAGTAPDIEHRTRVRDGAARPVARSPRPHRGSPCPGRRGRTPAPRRGRAPSAWTIPSHATGASRVSPRGSSLDQSGIEAGDARRARPTGTSHSSAARSPCQRTEYDTGPSFVGASRTSSGSPRHSGGHAPSSSMSVPLASHERAAERVEELSGGSPSSVAARRPTTRDPLGDGPPCVGRRCRGGPMRRGPRRRSPSLRAPRPPRGPPSTPARRAGAAHAPSRPRLAARGREARPASPGRAGRATRGRPARRRAPSRRRRRRSDGAAAGTAAASGARPGSRNAASSRAPRSPRGVNASSRAPPLVTIWAVVASSVIAHLAGGRSTEDRRAGGRRRPWCRRCRRVRHRARRGQRRTAPATR